MRRDGFPADEQHEGELHGLTHRGEDAGDLISAAVEKLRGENRTSDVVGDNGCRNQVWRILRGK